MPEEKNKINFMIKQKGFIRLTGGSLGETTFVKSQDGYRAQEKKVTSPGKFKTDPKMASVRENASEFGSAATAGRVLRNSVNSLVQTAKDNRMVSRLAQAIRKVMSMDTVSPHGQRNLLDGDLTKLVGFQFNLKSNTKTMYPGDFTSAVNRVTGELSLTIPVFDPLEVMLDAPTSATHFEIVSAGSEVDFALHSAKTDTKVSAKFPLSHTPTTAIANVHATTANSTKPLFLVFGIRFYKVFNGFTTSLNAGGDNALTILQANKP